MSEGSGTPAASEIRLTIKSSNGSSFTVTADPSMSVGDFKKVLSDKDKANIPPENIRLIFAGHVLKDPLPLSNYGLKDGVTVHLVRGGTAAVQPQQSAASTSPSIPASTSASPSSTTANASGNPFGGFGGFGGGGGNLNLQNVQQQLLQNPDMMREVMSSPMVQSMMNNPELIRSILLSNPQMRDIIERNPEVGHVLNDPQILRQTLELARNPELMREMMRTSDRAMSNLDVHPEGFSFLRRMYTNVQEPMMNAATQNQSTATPPASNPFAALFGNMGNMNQQSQQDSLNNQTPSSNPNSNPLPNPWASGSRTPLFGGSRATPSQSQSQSPSSQPEIVNPFGMMGMSNTDAQQQLNNMMGGGMFDLNTMTQLLQNPAIQSMMQQMMSSPEFLQQMAATNPLMANMIQNNPQLGSMMANPQLMQQLTNPNTLNALIQMQNAMQQLQSSGFFNAFGGPMVSPFGATGTTDTGAPTSTPATPATTSPPTPTTASTPTSTGTAATPNPFDWSQMFNTMVRMNPAFGSVPPTSGVGTAGTVGSPDSGTTGASSQEPPEIRYQVQLQQLEEMGFTDKQKNINALIATSGNVQLAIERLLSQ